MKTIKPHQILSGAGGGQGGLALELAGMECNCGRRLNCFEGTSSGIKH